MAKDTFNGAPLLSHPTEFFTPEEFEFGKQGVLPTGQPAPQLIRQCDKPEGIAQEFIEVYHDLGGRDFLMDWAQQNPGAFVNHLRSLAPRQQQLTTENSHEFTFRHVLPPGPLDGYDEIAEDAEVIPLDD